MLETYTYEAPSPPVEPESTVDDPATPPMEQDPHVSTDDLEISLDDPPVQDMELQTKSEVTYQLFEKRTKRGKDKLIDRYGYTYIKKCNDQMCLTGSVLSALRVTSARL